MMILDDLVRDLVEMCDLVENMMYESSRDYMCCMNLVRDLVEIY